MKWPIKIIHAALVTLMFFFTSGCSPFIYHAGFYSSVLDDGKSRVQIRKCLGEPIQTYPRADVFRKFSKIYRTSEAGDWDTSYAMFVGCTMGLGELIALPVTTVQAIIETFSINTIYVLYDDDQNYMNHRVNDPLFLTVYGGVKDNSTQVSRQLKGSTSKETSSQDSTEAPSP